MIHDRRLTFIWDVYKGCRISAMAIFDAYNREWVPKAHTYWKRGNEKHLGTLTDEKRFATHGEAESHALSLARGWCDEHMLEVVPSPVSKLPGEGIRE